MIQTDDKLQCARRELALRRRVYPRQIEKGRMTRDQAERETQLMAAIVDDYEKQAEAERLL